MTDNKMQSSERAQMNGDLLSYLSQIERQIESEFDTREAILAKLFLSIKCSSGLGNRMAQSFKTLARETGNYGDLKILETLSLFQTASQAVFSYMDDKYLEIARQLGISNADARRIKDRVYSLETRF